MDDEYFSTPYSTSVCFAKSSAELIGVTILSTFSYRKKKNQKKRTKIKFIKLFKNQYILEFHR
jgi:hypothetical protein